jgi:hypothetical protein
MAQIERTAQQPDEILIRTQLQAMRHLPPGTTFPQPTNNKLRQLLEDLLSLPEEIDPFAWAQKERGNLIAELAFRFSLGQFIRMNRQYQHIAATSPQRTLSLGALLITPADEPFWSQWAEEALDAIPLDRLLTAFSQLRERHQSQPQTTRMNPTGSNYQQLLSNLMDLPPTVDTMQWLQDESGRVTTALVLSNMLSQCRPSHGFLQSGVTLRQWYPRETALSTPEIQINVNEVTLKENGFALQVEISFSAQSLPWRAGEEGKLSLFWSGFDRVVDNLGYHYLVIFDEGESSSPRFGWYRERLSLACYPAIVPQATELTCSAEPIIVTVQSLSSPEHRPILLPNLSFGNFSWRVSLPR